MILSQEKKRVLDFFETEVTNYLLGDIEILEEIRPNKFSFRSCAVPHAMMLFAVIDYFGFLTRDDNPNPKKEDTQGNSKYLLTNPDFFPIQYKNDWEKLIKLFRHGIMHNSFPKACGISKPGLINYNLFFESNGILILNVDVLSRDVKSAVGKIKSFIYKSNDNILAERISLRLNKLQKENYKDLKKTMTKLLP
jgi:hypothetical protein